MQILLPYSCLLRLSLLVTLCLWSFSARSQTGCNSPVAIQWVDLYGVSVASDNGLTKTVATGWNAGAASQNGLEVGEGGWVEWTAGPMGNQYLVGLSYVNIDHNYGSLNFGIQYLGNGTANLVENGSVKITLTAITESDVFRVERAGSEIRYLRNNGLIRWVAVDATKRMLADVSVHTGKTPTILASFCVPVKAAASLIPANCGGSDGSISLNTFGGTPPYSYLWNDGVNTANRSGLAAGTYSVTVSDAAGGSIQYHYLVGSRSPWKDVVGVTVNADNSLSRNSGSGWNAGAASVNFIEANQNGWVEWSSPAVGSKYVVGLSFTNPDAGFGSIAYGIYHDGSGNIHCLETNGTINNLAGDKAINLFRVERKDKSIHYYKNGTVVRTVALDDAQASKRMLVDVSLNTGQIPTLHLSFCNSYVWNGSVSSNWNNSANWTPNGVPGTGDYVTISAKPNHPVLDIDRSIGSLTFNSGNLNLSGFSLTVNGNTYLAQGNLTNGNLIVTGGEFKTGGSYNTIHWGPVLNGVNLTVTASSLYLFKATITGTISLTKTGAVNDGYQSKWNVFNGPVSITNAASTSLTFGGGGYPDIFNGELSLSNSGASYICMAYNSVNNQFNGDVILESTAGAGIYLGFLGGSNCRLAEGKRLLIGSRGFSAGALRLIRFTQLGNTTQELTLTGSSSLSFENSTMNAVTTCKVPNIGLSNSRFNSDLSVEKISGGANETGGGNVFNGKTIFINLSTSALFLSRHTPDIYNDDVTFTNTGSSSINPAHTGALTQYNGNVILNCTNGKGIVFSGNGGTAQIAAGKSLQIGGVGFSAGDLGLYGITQLGDTPQSLELTGSSRLYIGSVHSTRSTFNGTVNFKAPALFLNGSIFNNTARFERTGSWDNTSMWAGGNILNGTTTIINSSSQQLMMNANSINPNDIYNGDVSFFNIGTGIIRFAGALKVYFNGHVQFNSTNGSGCIFDGGFTQLANGKTISAGTFNIGRLQLTNFKQLGNTSQTINITGSGQLWMNNCSFEGAVDLTAGAFNLVNNRFVGETILTRTANINNYCNGNTFSKKLKINNRASWPFTLGNPTDDIVK